MDIAMEVDSDMMEECLSVGQNVEVGTENGLPRELAIPLSPACSQISESDVSVTSERGSEQLDLDKLIAESLTDTSKIPMRKLRKACPELYRRCYQTKKGKRKVKHSWDPVNKPSDWPSNVKFVDPNNGVKGKDGRFCNKPGRKDLDLMFIFLRDKLLMMSKAECEGEQKVVKTEEKPLVKSVPVEESMPAPGPTIDIKRITERKDSALARIKEQLNDDPFVQVQLDSIMRKLCGQYNRLIANPQGMLVYMDFIKHCRKIEELTDNMAAFGSAFLTQYFGMYSQQILDELREPRRLFNGGVRQETSMNAIQVHGVASSDDVAVPHGVMTQNPVNIQSDRHVITSRYTEAPPCDTKVEVDEKKCVPGTEQSTPFQTVEKTATVGYCLEGELNTDWEALFKKQDGLYDDVIKAVADDDDMFKHGATVDEMFNLLQVNVRNVDPQDKADESKSLEKEFKLELPATDLVWESQYQDDTPLMEGVEDGSDLLYNETNECVENQPPTEQITLASLNAPVSLGASLNTFGSRSPIDIHSSTASQGVFEFHDVDAGSNFQQEFVPGEIPSSVEEFNEPDVVMEDAPMSNTYPDLGESFSELSGFSLDVLQVTDSAWLALKDADLSR